MQSIFALLLVAIIKRVKDKVPEIRWIDQDFGQLEHYDERPPVSFPCALIDFGGTNYEDLSQQVQKGDLTMRVRLAFAPFSNSNSITPEYVLNKALDFFEIELKFYQSIQNWSPYPEICQPFTRISVTTERREDTLRVRPLEFTTSFMDSSAQKVYTKVPRPALEEEYNKDL